MKRSFAFAAVLLLAAGISSCTENHELHVDLIAPTNGQAFSIGDDVHFDMHAHSNNELSKYRIEIHPEGSSSWEFEQEWPLTGKDVDVHHHEIVVPATASAGDYHFEVMVFTQAGDSASKHVDIKVN